MQRLPLLHRLTDVGLELVRHHHRRIFLGGGGHEHRGRRLRHRPGGLGRRCRLVPHPPDRTHLSPLPRRAHGSGDQVRARAALDGASTHDDAQAIPLGGGASASYHLHLRHLVSAVHRASHLRWRSGDGGSSHMVGNIAAGHVLAAVVDHRRHQLERRARSSARDRRVSRYDLWPVHCDHAIRRSQHPHRRLLPERDRQRSAEPRNGCAKSARKQASVHR
mmetsp:Transcript_96468/g.278432  ORF Transcript_96468/g.278432 Transcript_96468/m.278432 type:complete len:220 (+) Transcript_96468:708-1367(+)